MKNIKKILGITTAFGALLPLLKVTVSPSGFEAKAITLGLVNLGIKPTIAAFVIIALSLYVFYLSDFLQEKLSIVFATVNLILVLTVSIIFRMEVKQVFNQNLTVKLLNVNHSYSWGWIVLFVGTLGLFVISLLEFKKSRIPKEITPTPENKTEIKEETKVETPVDNEIEL
ncbi:hypothetical protein [Streptobacillus canis]|uniref:hypothetical protein n=1 Tax=Streptobacillus canis TaxID=2678686 RepID=UPI0012E29F53|nr:hypothetical protein [Streptobacillus canis]